jgi:glutamate dehydrogenase
VAALTLADNYLQAQAISVTEALGTQSLDRLQQVMRYGETRQALDRAQEFLPTEKTIEERQAAGIGMTRPEIAVMLAYSKNLAQQTLLGTQALDDPYMDRAVAGYLPTTLRQEFAHLLPRHPMRRELTASMLNNELHNRAGSGILLRLQQLTLDASNHIRATVVARDVLNLPEIWAGIDALDLTRHAHDQVLLLIECRRVFEQAALWFLRNRREIDMAGEVGRFRPALRELAPRLRGFLPARQRAAVDQRIAGLIGNGVPEPLCERVFVLQALCSGMDIATIASAYDRELDWTAGLYFALGETLGLDWLERQLADRHGESHWTALAKTSLRDDLLTQNRWLAAAAVRNAHGQVAPEEAVAAWLTRNSDRVQLYRQTLASMEETAHPDVPMLSVAVQELRNLAQVGGAGAGP